MAPSPTPAQSTSGVLDRCSPEGARWRHATPGTLCRRWTCPKKWGQPSAPWRRREVIGVRTKERCARFLPFLSCLLALELGCKKAEVGKNDRKPKLSGLTRASLFNRSRRANLLWWFQIYHIRRGRYCCPYNRAPRSWEPARTHSNYGGAVTEAARAHCRWCPITLRPPAPFHLPEDATSKGVPVPHASGHVTDDSTAPRPAPKTVAEYSPRGVPYQGRNCYSEPY